MYKIVVEILEGWGGYFGGQKMVILGRRGAYVEFPLWWGMDIFWNYAVQPHTRGNFFFFELESYF